VPTLPRPATARGEATRQRLLDAAEAEIGAQGFHATSVAAITRRAGVGQGTFYLYFPTKEDALRALVRHMGRELRRALAQATAGAGDRLAAERRGFEAFARFSLEHRNLYRVVMESQFVDEAVYRDYYQSLADAYAAGLERAVGRGELRAIDPVAAAWALMGIAHFVGLRYAIWEERDPPPEALDAVFDLVRHALEPRP
jgi:AcrR family transcriptional regulator